MEYRYQAPDPKLAPYVRTVLMVEGGKSFEGSKVPLFTNGMAALLFRSTAESILELALYGKSTPADRWEVKKGACNIAFFFKPFSLAPMFNLDAINLKATSIDLRRWNAHKANALWISLAGAKTLDQKIEELEHLLLIQLKEQGEVCEIIQRATERLMSDTGTEALSSLLKELGLQERTLQRIFKKHVGVTPNQFRRICQFQFSFTRVRGGRFDHLTDVAFDSGFADQSHFIRTFKEFTKMRPLEYLKTGLKRKKR